MKISFDGGKEFDLESAYHNIAAEYVFYQFQKDLEKGIHDSLKDSDKLELLLEEYAKAYGCLSRMDTTHIANLLQYENPDK